MTTETRDIGKLLREPFHPDDIEWRIGQAGKNQKGEIWAKVLAYVTNRAIMYRLDDVLGVDGWKVRYRPWHVIGSSHSQICELSLRIGGEWITKEDGADCTDIESVKGGLSDAMKRAAVQFGIGRYLYSLEEGWAEISPERQGWPFRRANTKDLGTFYWAPPALPDWALPLDMRKEKEPASPPPEKHADKPNGGMPNSMSEMGEAMTAKRNLSAEFTGKLIDRVAQLEYFAELETAEKYACQQYDAKKLTDLDQKKLLVAILDRRIAICETEPEIDEAESQYLSLQKRRFLTEQQTDSFAKRLESKRARLAEAPL